MQLDRSLSDESSLKECAISVRVDDGDVTLTGSVRSQTEAEHANDIAINVPGVRSVANALRVSR